MPDSLLLPEAARSATGRVALGGCAINAETWGVLEGWRENLITLIHRQKVCPARTENVPLETQFVAAIRGAREDIDDALAESKAAMMAAALAAMEPFFDYRGDARLTAESSPAFIACRQFLRGPVCGATREWSLAGLAREARVTIDLIDRVFRGGELWVYEPGRAALASGGWHEEEEHADSVAEIGADETPENEEDVLTGDMADVLKVMTGC